jgi:Zn-dependent membrane protease YugP
MNFILIFLIAGPLIVSLFARGRFQAVYDASRKVEGSSTLTGAGVARKILEASGCEDVEIVEHWGLFPDYYDPAKKRLALSRPHFRGSNAAAYGIAAHEAGHALQDKQRFDPLKRRITAIKMTQYLSPKVALILMFASWGALLLYNLSTMPVEADATQRSRETLDRLRILRDHEQEQATYRMMKAAGLMYVSGFLNTVKWLIASVASGMKG